MEKITSQLTDVIKGISELGIGLIALIIIAEIVFGQGALFGASVVGLSGIVAPSAENGFIGLIAIILIFALLRKRA